MAFKESRGTLKEAETLDRELGASHNERQNYQGAGESNYPDD